MDKSDFVRLAPKYYMLAIIQEMRKSYGHLSETAMRESYTYNDPGGDDYCYIPNKYLMKIALDNLASTGAIEIIKDDFGPALYRKTDQFEQAVEALEIDLDGPFYKCKVSPDCEAWVRSALSKVNDTSTELDITGEDFNRPDQEWAPIPLDHDNKSLKTAIDLLDKVTQQIEQSNGYAAAYPEERNFVVDNLNLLSSRLKTAATISLSYLRIHGLNVLKKVQEKFVDTAIGEVAKETIKAIGHWMHEIVANIPWP